MPPQSRSITPEQARPRPSRSTPHITQQRQRSSMAVTSNSDSDESTSSSENDSEDDTIQLGKHSIYARQRAKAKSEIGHHPPSPSKPPDLPPYRAPKSHIGHVLSPQQRLSGHELKNINVPDVPPFVSSQLVPGVRPRASVSASALSPTAAAKRASILVASNSKLG
jgi:serine/arginine repetitive matrix protein 2